jgi:hypothetical protein
MKITEYGSIRSASDLKKLRRKNAAGETSFADILNAASETDETASTGDISAPSSVGNMLALQEISEEELARQKTVQRGKTLLDSLEKLRQQLLIGVVPARTLHDLNRQLSLQKQQISDPHLLSVIEDIELRAAVELAKLQMAAKMREE